MKRIFGRFGLRGPSLAPGEEPAADDEGYFATQFLEPPVAGEPEQAWPTSHSEGWSSRAAELGAEPLDPETGIALLRKAWGDDALMLTLSDDDLARLRTHLDFFSVPPGQELIQIGRAHV